MAADGGCLLEIANSYRKLVMKKYIFEKIQFEDAVSCHLVVNVYTIFSSAAALKKLYRSSDYGHFYTICTTDLKIYLCRASLFV